MKNKCMLMIVTLLEIIIKDGDNSMKKSAMKCLVKNKGLFAEFNPPSVYGVYYDWLWEEITMGNSKGRSDKNEK